jgi:hypothetical protein
VADGVSITAGSGTTIATDDVSSVHYQRVKLVDGTADSSAVIPGDATNGLDVDVTRVSGTVTVASTAQANDASGIGATPTVLVVGGKDASNNARSLLTASTGRLSVDINGGTTVVTQSTASNLNVQELNSTTINTAVQLLDDAIVADDAAFTVATTKVNVAGFLADDASPDGADEGDAVAARTTLDRKLVVAVGESGANLVRGGGSKTDTTDQSIMAAGGAGTYNYLTWLAVYNASSTNTYVNVKDGSTVVAVVPLPAYGGAVMNLTTPIRATAATAINLATGASVTTAYLYGGGYRGL